ncbi:MAG: hypothetical protein IH991_07480 [Planctomycetes bacterium]|nr:hypothetical protein [Planctomycetota bacterium]
MKKLAACFATLLAIVCCSTSHAEVKVTDVLTGLDNPCGVAIQPGTGHVFVADSGAKRVIRVVDGKAEDVICDFPVDVYGKGPKYNIGPLGIAFLDENTLVVGGGGFIDDKELLRVYKVPAAGKPAIKADKMAASFTLPANEDLKAEGNYYGIAVTETAIFVTCNGDDTKGWIAKADRKGDKVMNFRRFIATKEATELDAPVAITINPRGHVVVGQMGEITVPEDSLLTFYNAKKGKMLLNLETGLYDITGLAYSPGDKSQLYALDFAWMKRDPDSGQNSEAGLFHIVANRKNKQSAKVKKVIGLNQPTAMAFAEDGTLYVTLGNDQSTEKTGKLVKIDLGK